MGLRLRSLKKTVALFLSAAVLMSAMPCMEVLAAEQYPFVYGDIYAKDKDYMVLTEGSGDYVVLPGDSLWKIAEQLLGNGNSYVELINANQDILTDPDLIYPGMCLNVSRTGYILRKEAVYGGIQMDSYSMDMPYGWTIGTTQSGGAGGNFVMSGDGAVACLIQDRTKEASASVLDWQECAQQITTYAEENYREQVTGLQFEHYRMEEQEDASGELYLYSYTWHISPDDYPTLTCRVCIGLKLTEHIQAEFVGYALDDYDIEGCVRYITASFEEHYDAGKAEKFTVNDSNMSIVPETEWPLEGMYNSFAYMNEFFTALLNEALGTETTEKSRYNISCFFAVFFLLSIKNIKRKARAKIMWIADNWKDYEVIDTSAGEKLERWGDYLLVRPDPQVIWNTPKEHSGWRKKNGHYHRSSKGGGEWEFFNLPDEWSINYKELTFHLKPFSFKHTGLFPEQAANWDWFSSIIKESVKETGRPAKVLNLFAYTGGATLAAASAGAAVTHVDASKGMVTWAKENAAASGLGDAPIRWLVDDCVKFVEREIRRGNTYDAIIMDPPSYGRGPKGEIWKIEESIFPFLELTARILSKDALFFIINSYTTGLQPAVLSYMLHTVIVPAFGGKVQADEIGLPVSSNGLILPCGASGRWSAL